MKSKILFGIFCFLIFSALVAGLIFFNKFNNDENQKGEPLPKEDGRIYATNVFLNCPRELTITVGSEVKLADGFLTIEPANTTEKLEIEISSKVGNDDGISFGNNTILAKNTGYYYIKFSVPESDKYDAYDTLVVHAVETNQGIEQIKNSAFEQETCNINELFNINPIYSVSSVQTSSSIEFSNNEFKLNSVGSANINITLTLGLVNYNYEFIFTINKLPDPPKYQINISNYETNNIELDFVFNKIYTIAYEITNEDEKDVPQSVDASVSDESIATLIPFGDMFIRFRCKEKGTFTLTIVCGADTTVFKTLTITLK